MAVHQQEIMQRHLEQLGLQPMILTYDAGKRESFPGQGTAIVISNSIQQKPVIYLKDEAILRWKEESTGAPPSGVAIWGLKIVWPPALQHTNQDASSGLFEHSQVEQEDWMKSKEVGSSPAK